MHNQSVTQSQKAAYVKKKKKKSTQTKNTNIIKFK